jgi:cation:H+ antiporter
MVWLYFGLCAAIILFAGSRASEIAEAIAEKSGLGKNWIAMVLLAVIASSSQLIASVSSVTVHDLPELAVGALVGSSMFNMLVIGMLDLFSKRKPVSNMVQNGHILSAGFGIILLGLVAIDIMFGKHLPSLTLLHQMDPITLAIVPIYLIAMRLVFKFESSRATEPHGEELPHVQNEPHSSWTKLISRFLLSGLLIVSASSYLPTLAEQIQAQTGWGEGFIGLSFIAITTCLPEIGVSTSAARRGSFDIAVGSLLGSNLCYIVILAICDFCYLKEPLLRHVSSQNALAAMCAIISMAIVIIGLTYRAEKKLRFMAGDAAALVLTYLFANFLLFTNK